MSSVQPNDDSETCDDTQGLLHHASGTGSMSPHTQNTFNCETDAQLQMEFTHSQEYTEKSKQVMLQIEVCYFVTVLDVGNSKSD